MAKHPHKLMLFHKKTWRCTLDGCSFFVHLGLAHVLLGKQAICWGCGDEFRLDDDSLREEQPRCMDCRSNKDAMSRKVDKMLKEFSVSDVSELPEKMQEKIRALRGIKDIEPTEVTVTESSVIPDKPIVEPKRTAAQQKEYEENMRIYAETIKNMGGK